MTFTCHMSYVSSVLPVILSQSDAAVSLSEIQFVLKVARIVVTESHVNVLTGCFILTQVIERG